MLSVAKAMIGLSTARGSNRPNRSHGGRGLLLAARRRQGANAAGLLMFVAGFIVAPCLHTFNHRDDHEHGADGSVVAHLSDVHGPTRVDSLVSAGDAVSGNHRHSHGQGSLAHFGVALTTPGAFVVPPAPTSFDDLAPPDARRNPVVRRWQNPIRSRGPPTRSPKQTSDTFPSV
ncbi:MAG TPA: hypothetical protein VFH73_22440 [Polyangia bacterium]|nr:hypothetical protein [Polyangia bacterium]